MGKRFQSILIASALMVACTANAQAADFGGTYKPAAPQTYKPAVEPVPVPAPVPVAAEREYYLKGYIGFSNQEVEKLDPTHFAVTGAPFNVLDAEFDSGGIFGLGFGMRLNDRFRGDFTGEYRGGASFTGLDVYGGPGAGTNEYTAIKKEWLFLANAYWDMGNWRGVTPYLGAGIGYADIGITGFKDVNVPQNSVASADDRWTGNFAWALHAGLAYDISSDVTVDLAYRYVNLGDASSGTIVTYDGAQTVSPVEFKDVTSHDLMLGVRWKFGDDHCCATAAYSPAPVPAPVYK
ncbi:MAG: outer membrane beta-barrel protein [Pseudomonadota bacterium]|nr:outer membrane beta-barrel protein [Pseudomonadota bacterium]